MEGAVAPAPASPADSALDAGGPAHKLQLEVPQWCQPDLQTSLAVHVMHLSTRNTAGQASYVCG